MSERFRFAEFVPEAVERAQRCFHMPPATQDLVRVQIRPGIDSCSEPGSSASAVVEDCPGPELRLEFVRASHTSAAVRIFQGGAIVAAAAYLCGIDPEDDAAATNLVGSWNLPLPAETWPALNDLERPVSALLFSSAEAYQDERILGLLVGTGVLFSSNLGACDAID